MPDESLKQRTAKGLLWGGLSNGAMQLLNLVFGIFLSRLLSPSDYGMVGVLAIFMSISGALLESGFISTIANKKEVSDADYNAVFWFNLLGGLFIYALLFFAAPWIAEFNHNPALTPLARFLFLGIPLACTGTAPTAYLFRHLRVKERAYVQMLGVTISGLVGVILAYNGFAYWGLAIQQVLFITFSTGLIWFFCPWKPSWKINFQPLRLMLPFSLKLLFTNVFVQANNNFFSFLLGRFYTTQLVGYYTQGNKWTTMGFSFISGTITAVAQPVLHQAGEDRDRYRAVFRKMLRFTAFLTFPLMWGLALVAEEFIVAAITDKWVACVPIIQLLCIWGAVAPLQSLYSHEVISHGKPSVHLWLTVSLCLGQLLLAALTFQYGLLVMVGAFVAFNIVWMGFWQYFSWRYFGLTLRMVILDLAPYACVALASIFVAWWAGSFFTNLYLILGVKILVVAILYIGILYALDATLLKESIAFLLKKKKTL